MKVRAPSTHFPFPFYHTGEGRYPGREWVAAFGGDEP
jgi:hypothetical protein